LKTLKLHKWALGLVVVSAIAVTAVVFSLQEPIPAPRPVAAAEPLFPRYVHSVFSGDLSWMLDLDSAAYENDAVYPQFQTRFIEKEVPSTWQSVEQGLAREALLLYRDYWIAALLDPSAMDEHEQNLADSIDDLLTSHGMEFKGEDAFERLQLALSAEGWGFQGGRTPPLQDFILWRNEETVDYEVTLTDGLQPVRVNFLEDFISMGWSNFATFGHTSTGGWANKEALYCIREHYPDLEAERFRVAYLTHEARHFSDYLDYPELEPADLEYRGKLTQLYFAETEGPQYLDQFRKTANNNTPTPHPLANWFVLERLGEILGIDAFDPDAMKDIPWNIVAQASLELLESHSQQLNQAGAETVTGLIAGPVSAE